THIRHIDEVGVNQPVYAETQVISGRGKKLHVFHTLYHGDGRVLATGEHLLIHVSLETRSASEPSAEILEKLTEIATLHAALPTPEGAGRAIGQPR
ncbi:MAG: carnitine 3-dehydrogenase, partial [bacterium]